MGFLAVLPCFRARGEEILEPSVWFREIRVADAASQFSIYDVLDDLSVVPAELLELEAEVSAAGLVVEAHILGSDDASPAEEGS